MAPNRNGEAIVVAKKIEHEGESFNRCEHEPEHAQRGPSPEHSSEASCSAFRFRSLRQQIMELSLQSHPHSPQTLFRDFSQPFAPRKSLFSQISRF